MTTYHQDAFIRQELEKLRDGQHVTFTIANLDPEEIHGWQDFIHRTADALNIPITITHNRGRIDIHLPGNPRIPTMNREERAAHHRTAAHQMHQLVVAFRRLRREILYSLHLWRPRPRP